MEDDFIQRRFSAVVERFQSTSPVWRTTEQKIMEKKKRQFQSTSPVWRTTKAMVKVMYDAYISIHVPRVEDDGKINAK